MEIVIYGGPGSGKTRLLRALTERLGQRQIHVLDGNVENPQIKDLFKGEEASREPFNIPAPVRNYMVCATCGLCAKNCPFGAISKEDLWIDPLECEGCGICARHCPQKALEMVNMQVGEMVKTEGDNQILFHGELMPGAQGGPLMVERLRHMATEGADMVLAETYGLGEAAARLLDGADVVVVVMSPREQIEVDRLYRLSKGAKKFLVPNRIERDGDLESMDLVKGLEEKGFTVLPGIPEHPDPETQQEKFVEIAGLICSNIH